MTVYLFVFLPPPALERIKDKFAHHFHPHSFGREKEENQFIGRKDTREKKGRGTA